MSARATRCSSRGEDLDSPVRRGGWRATGDQVECIGDRCYFVGRRSDHINVGGNKVQPLRVEQVIQTVPGVQDVRVFGKRSSLVGEMVACEFVVKPDFDPDQVKQAILALCRIDCTATSGRASSSRFRPSRSRTRARRSGSSHDPEKFGRCNSGRTTCRGLTSPMNEPESKPVQRHVIVSGGSRGLGKTLVEGLLAGGYLVSTFSRNRTDFIDQRSAEAAFFFETADVCEPQTLSRFLEGAKEKFGPPYGLVNCAGVATVGVLPLLRDQQIDQAIATNLRGTLVLTRLVLRQMRLGGGGGSIVNISSVVGLRGYRGMAVYAATKGGIDAMTRALARELGSWGIRVNSVAPGTCAQR